MLPRWERCWRVGLEDVTKAGVGRVIGQGSPSSRIRGAEGDGIFDQVVAG